MRQKEKHFLLTSVLLFTLLKGCSTEHSPEPARYWGGVGFLYDNSIENSSSSLDREHSVSAVHIGIEKQLTEEVGFGLEVAGTLH